VLPAACWAGVAVRYVFCQTVKYSAITSHGHGADKPTTRQSLGKQFYRAAARPTLHGFRHAMALTVDCHLGRGAAGAANVWR